MSVRGLALAVASCTLIAMSMGACYTAIEAEPQVPPVIVLANVGGFLAGGWLLVLSTFRLWNPKAQKTWPSIAQSTILFFGGLVLTIAAAGALYLSGGIVVAFMGDTVAALAIAAVVYGGSAFTVGAFMMLFRAIGIDALR